jgi:hypothetical protein
MSNHHIVGNESRPTGKCWWIRKSPNLYVDGFQATVRVRRRWDQGQAYPTTPLRRRDDELDMTIARAPSGPVEFIDCETGAWYAATAGINRRLSEPT